VRSNRVRTKRQLQYHFTSPAANANKPKRGPVFRATADQVKQAQAILKQRSFYSGDQTGKLSTETRAGLKEYQKAEGLKVTGTLNKTTLVKMGIELTEKQKTM
jgi:peptidoglycan hydrolase-like protein with peptidoglycan-binding domain